MRLYATFLDEIAAIEQLLNNILDVQSRIEVVSASTAEQRHHLGAPLTSGNARNKKPCFSSKGNLLDDVSTMPFLYCMFVSHALPMLAFSGILVAGRMSSRGLTMPAGYLASFSSRWSSSASAQ